MQQKLQNLHQVFCAKLGSDRGKAKFVPVKFSKMLNVFFWDLTFFLDFNFRFFNFWTWNLHFYFFELGCIKVWTGLHFFIWRLHFFSYHQLVFCEQNCWVLSTITYSYLSWNCVVIVIKLFLFPWVPETIFARCTPHGVQFQWGWACQRQGLFSWQWCCKLWFRFRFLHNNNHELRLNGWRLDIFPE